MPVATFETRFERNTNGRQ